MGVNDDVGITEKPLSRADEPSHTFQPMRSEGLYNAFRIQQNQHRDV